MRKRITAFLLALVLTAVPVRAGAADGPAVTASDVEVNQGSTATVTVKAENFSTVGTVDFSIYYDSEAMTLSSAANGALLSGDTFASVNTDTAGVITVSAMAATGFTGKGTLLTLKFTVSADCEAGTYPIAVAVGDAYGTDLAALSVGSTDGSVTVKEVSAASKTFRIYSYLSKSAAQQGDLITVRIANGNYFNGDYSFASADFTMDYDPELLEVESVQLENAMLSEGAIYSVNTDLVGSARIVYAATTPVNTFYLFQVTLRVVGNADASATVTTTASNVYAQDLTAYQSYTTSSRLTLSKLPEVVDDPNVWLDTGMLVVDRQTVSTVKLEQGCGLAAGDFTVTYDPQVLRCVSVDASADALEAGSMVMVNPNWADGTVKFSYIHTDGYTGSQLPLVDILWEPLASPASHYRITVTGSNVVDVDYNGLAYEYVADTGCIYEAVVTQATCTDQGYTVYTCGCGESYTSDYVEALGHELVDGICRHCQKVSVDGQHFATVTGALAAANGSYACLLFDAAEDVTVSEDAYLDLNGCTLTGDITVADGATLYVFDSATSCYTAEDRGRIVGSVTGELARSFNTPAVYGHNYKYLAIEEETGIWSFHRYYLTVKSAVLVPYMQGEDYTGTAVNYKTVFKCNDVMARYVTAYGTKLVGDSTVYADAMGTLDTGTEALNIRTARLAGIMKTANTPEQNAANALLTPAVSAYITLTDGTEITSSSVQRSLREMVVYANSQTGLTNIERMALGAMYNLFRDVLDTWTDLDISTIKQYGESIS